VSVETHRIYPIGLQDDGDTLCAEVWERGYVNWFRWYGIFDYDEDGYILDDRPTIPEQPLVESWLDDDAGGEERRDEDPTAAPAAA
jgi:hypothetical protein